LAFYGRLPEQTTLTSRELAEDRRNNLPIDGEPLRIGAHFTIRRDSVKRVPEASAAPKDVRATVAGYRHQPGPSMVAGLERLLALQRPG
jgi:hypothetical protein